MALCIFTRRTASSMRPLAIRAVGSKAPTVEADLNVHNHGKRCHEPTRFSFSPRHFSSGSKAERAVDKEILQIIDSKVKEAQESTQKINANEIQGFEIQETSEDEALLVLEKVYGDEKILVKVSKCALETGREMVPVGVYVSKGSKMSLLFHVNTSPSGMTVSKILTLFTSGGLSTYEEPTFLKHEAAFLNAFSSYLAIRGIEPSLMNSLRQHFYRKDSREVWLKALKQFIEM